MDSLQDLRDRLAREQRALRSRLAEIKAARQRIDAAERESAALRKRIALLRQYLQLAEAGEALELPEAATELPEPAPGPEAGPEEPILDAPIAPPSETAPEMPPEAEPGDGAVPAAAESAGHQGRLILDDLDEKRLSEQLLPRTGSLEEALLLLLGYRGRAMKPATILKEFRRLDYLPEGTDASVDTELELKPQFFEPRAGGGYALTEEGLDEAHRLLARLL